MTIKVFGHKSPDTDSTGSPLIWAWYLTEVAGQPAEARAAGRAQHRGRLRAEALGLREARDHRRRRRGRPGRIVDTNNPAELPADIDEADIVQIIDHHKLTGGLETKAPIDITIRPLACTATIMHNLMGPHADRDARRDQGR